MLTAIEIENFKGFGKRQRIELAPITLMFGANSAGKSSFFQALFYLQKIFATRSAELGELPYFSDRIDLGDYSNTVFMHEERKSIEFRLEFWVGEDSRHGNTVSIANGDFYWGKETLQLEIGVACTREGTPFVSKYRLLIEDEPMIEVVNIEAIDGFETKMTAYMQNIDEWIMDLEVVDLSFPYERFGSIRSSGDLPWKFAVELLPGDWHIADSLEIESSHAEELESNAVQQIGEIYEASFNYVKTYMDDLLYVGPLRDVPREKSWLDQVDEDSSWEQGLAAWKELGDSPSLLSKTNNWLQRLKAGMSLETIGPIVRVRPASFNSNVSGVRIQDVGIGIPQVVPLIVGLQLDFEKTVLFEQPELHLHPIIQTELGDLLVVTCLHQDPDTQSIIETHSEHLILRILRRVRETHDNELPDALRQVFPSQVAVHYFESTVEGTKVTRLRIGEDGEFIDRWPYGFFDERAEELF